MQKAMMPLVRRGRRRGRETWFLVTWDIDSSDRRAVDRVRHFVFGVTTSVNGRVYRYPGFVTKPGMRYIAQSALFVVSSHRAEICALLASQGVDHEAIPATVG